MKIKCILILLILATQVSVSGESFFNKLDYVTIEEIDVVAKKVTIDGVKYNYKMKVMDNSFYETLNKIRDLKFLRTNTKYYINTTRYYENKTEVVLVDYIGKIKPPY